ncbi:hypothetical protein Tco_1110579 [Tanacetum coccineum]|uniref:Uncharacterized protein n=1 Tax=Tanacetum coccineum TaxID=301880 RepID=A0ABQ5IJM1_9ASTR
MMDDPNITMEEYIRLEEEKARNRGKVFNWETAKYGKIWYDEDVHDLRSIENEFPAIAFNDSLKSGETLSCEPTMSSLNDDIDFKISFDDSDDEDYTVIFDKNWFSYKIISINDLKTDSENDNEKVNMPSLPPPEPAVSYFDDLDFFIDFENEFPAIVYNDAQTSKSDLLIEPTLNPQHINEFDLKDETSLSEYNEDEQNVLYFNDLFPFNIIQPDDLKSEKDNDDSEVDIIQSSGDGVIVDFETRLARIYRREVHRVQVFDFGGLPDLMAEGLSTSMLMEHRDAQGVSLFTSQAWRRLFDIRGPLVHELILEFFSTIRFGEAILDLDTLGALQFQLGGARHRLRWRQIPDKGDLRDYWIGISSAGDFLGTAPSYTAIRDPILRLCHRMITCSIAGRSQAPEKVIVTDVFYLRGMDVGSVNVPYLLARYLRLFAARRKSEALIFEGQFICVEIDDTWAWVALGPERQPDVAAGTHETVDDALVVDEGGQARMARLEENVHEIRGALAEQREVIGDMAMDFSRFTVWAASGIAQLLDSARVTYTPYSETRIPYQRRVRQRTSKASTSTAQQQLDP